MASAAGAVDRQVFSVYDMCSYNMSPDEKMFYERMLQWYEYDEYFNALDKG